MRDKVTGARRWVVKIGSALLTADGRGLDRNAMAVWVEQMVALHCAGIELVLVSSGGRRRRRYEPPGLGVPT